ncbi:MAG: hypothetical protein QOC93_2913 [Actinomycetota bacterium]|jgi:hypothetical protein|nr:hypothetical protein [Actinomycetota bacterium]
MGLLDRFRRSRPPAEAVAPLGPGERVTAWGRTADGGVLVATPLGLWVPESGRLGWHELHKARWDSGVLTLVLGVEAEPGVREDAPPRRFVLAEPGNLPAEIRTRVTRSVAFTAHHPLPTGGVRIVARRVPGRDGLDWVVRYDPGTARGPEEEKVVAELMAGARAAASPADL